MSNATRVGIVGSGARSGPHARAYKEFGNVEIVAFCDIMEERAAERAKEFGAEAVYTDYQDLISSGSVDVISICSANETHGLYYRISRRLSVEHAAGLFPNGLAAAFYEIPVSSATNGIIEN